jgi:dihydropteroate synthase
MALRGAGRRALRERPPTGDRICAVNEHELRSRRPLPGGELDGKEYVRRWHGTAVMGVINVTPDSFSDAGAFALADAAVGHGLRLARAGAMILDVGGESTRPGADPVPEELEAERVLPVVRALARESGALVSVDTYKPAVAREALRAGAHLVNDITGLRDPEMALVCGEAGAPTVIMHMQGEPRTMQANPTYRDVVAEVHGFLREAGDRAAQAGVPDVILDPGIGFGKRPEHNLALLRSLAELTSVAKVLVGASRKGLIAALAGDSAPAERDPGSLAIHLHAADCGAALVRVHDVTGHVQALRVWERLRG